MGLLRESTSREKQLFLVYSTVAVVFVLVYLILFPRTLPAEFTLVPNQALPLAESRTDKLSPGGQFFILGGWEGYWNEQGELGRVQPLRAHATASGDRIAWYDAPRNQVVVEGLKGTLFTVPGEQYPLWIRGRLFTLDENRMGIKALNAQGRALWTKQFSSLITAVDSTDRLTVVGTLDGRVQMFGPQGEPAGGFQPGGSRLPVVYNVSIAPQDGAVLVLAGVDPKRFLVLERGGNDFRPVFHKPLKENRPWPTPLGFLNTGALAYYETDHGIAFLDPRSPEREQIVSTGGSPLVLESLPGGRLVAFVERSGDRSTLRIASTEGASVLNLPFSSQDLLLKRQGSFVFLGLDQTLLRLEVRIQ